MKFIWKQVITTLKITSPFFSFYSYIITISTIQQIDLYITPNIPGHEVVNLSFIIRSLGFNTNGEGYPIKINRSTENNEPRRLLNCTQVDNIDQA